MYQLIVGEISWEWLDYVADDAPLKLSDAIFLDELGVDFSEKMLRTAIHAGTLPAEKHGRTLYVTKAGVREWRERCRVKSLPAYGSNQPATTKPAHLPMRRSGSSETDQKNIALDAARLTFRALKERSQTTSPRSTPPPLR